MLYVKYCCHLPPETVYGSNMKATRCIFNGLFLLTLHHSYLTNVVITAVTDSIITVTRVEYKGIIFLIKVIIIQIIHTKFLRCNFIHIYLLVQMKKINLTSQDQIYLCDDKNNLSIFICTLPVLKLLDVSKQVSMK